MFIHNPTKELVHELIERGEVISVEIDERTIELLERCNRCHNLVPAGSYCFCDWLAEPPAYLADEVAEESAGVADWLDERNSIPI